MHYYFAPGDTNVFTGPYCLERRLGARHRLQPNLPGRAFLQRRSRRLGRRYDVAVDLYFWLRGSSASATDAAHARGLERAPALFRTK